MTIDTITTSTVPTDSFPPEILLEIDCIALTE